MKVSTQLKRWYRWRYSGPITVFSIIVVAIISWHFATADISFYDKFTCPQMMEYKAGDYRVIGEPRYIELTEHQRQGFDLEYKKCLSMGWNPK